MTSPVPRMPLPYGMDLETWAHQMVECFPQDWIPVLRDKADWRRWAADFIDSPTFQRYRIPDPFQAKNWQEWAGSLVLALPFSQ